MTSRLHEFTNSVGLLILRLGVGGYMLTHGLGKLDMLIEGGQIDDLIGIGPKLSLVLIMLAEFGCAILVMLGFATRLAAIPLVFGMSVAAFVAHAQDPWTSGEGFRLFLEKVTPFPRSKEPALIYAIVFLALIFTGPGKFSVDQLIWPWWRARRERRAAEIVLQKT